jgi:hypothetical protein
MPITFEGLADGALTQVHVTDGRKTYFYNEKEKTSSWFLPPADIEKLVSLVSFHLPTISHSSIATLCF